MDGRLGLEITESILITETGVQTLCDVPRQLFVRTDAMNAFTDTEVANPISSTVDFTRDGVQHGFLKLPHSRDDSAWGAVMIPITVVKHGDGPTALLTGGNHGDEYEGPVALSKLAQRLRADRSADG